MNIDDIKLQLYVDGELDTKDISEVEKFIQDNPSAKKKARVIATYPQLPDRYLEKALTNYACRRAWTGIS